MNVEEAMAILLTVTKSELRDHAFGDVEVEWFVGNVEIAHGYFSGDIREVRMAHSDEKFTGEEADALRKCFAKEVVERNDETGPDEFELGQIMHGLAKEDVLRELTE